MKVCGWCGEGGKITRGLCKRHYGQWYDEQHREKRREQWRRSRRKRYPSTAGRIEVCRSPLCGRTFVQARNGQRKWCSACSAAFFWRSYPLRLLRKAA